MFDETNLSIIFKELTGIYVDKTQSNEKQLRIKDINSGLYINLKIEDIIYGVFYGNREKFISYLNSNFKIADLLYKLALEDIYSNHNLKLWLFSRELENRCISGFLDKKQNYAEFEIDENYEFICDMGDYIESYDLLTHFYLGDIEVIISSPSVIYKMLFFHHIYNQGIFNDIGSVAWNNRLTIRFKNIKGINKESLIENILQEALFLLRLYNMEIFNIGITVWKDKIYVPNFKNEKIKHFPKSLSADLFSYYNEAYRYLDDMRFLNFYKILEFSYNKGKDIHENIELLTLLNKEWIIDCTNNIIESYFEKQITVKEFSEWLYNIRNAIVHSKEKALSRIVPKILDDEDTFAKSNHGLKLTDWNEIIELLSFVCIQYYCYNNEFNLIEKYYEMRSMV